MSYLGYDGDAAKDGQKWTWYADVADHTLTGSVADYTFLNIVPDAMFLLFVQVAVVDPTGNETPIGGAGCDGYLIGDGTDDDMWGALTGLAAGAVPVGTTNAPTDMTATPIAHFWPGVRTVNDIVVTASTANFESGTLRCTVHGYRLDV